MFTKKVLLGAVLVSFVFLLYLYLLMAGLLFREKTETVPKANITVITAPSIPTVDSSLLVVTPTSTVPPNIEIDGITLGSYVKIEGTGGAGLRIRSAPGTSTDVVFLANESEVFFVIGGPMENDEMLWWQLEAPYDQARSGWASADYLVAIKE